MFGPLFKRPVEEVMGRLASQWQLSQPPRLRHLSIVRDTSLQRTQTIWVHYTYENFRAMVDRGETTWEAAQHLQKLPEGIQVNEADVDGRADEHGFPLMPRPEQMLENGEATLMEGLRSIEPAPFTVASSDLIVLQDQHGNCGKPPVSNSRFAKLDLC